MEKDFVTLTYTLPEAHIVERRPAAKAPIALAKEARRALGELRKYLRSDFERTSQYVKDSYEKQYRTSNAKWYRNYTDRKMVMPRIEGDKIIVSDKLVILSAHMQMLSHIFDQLDCRSVLDVGSGRGNNVIALASLRPEREYYGLELTQSGHERSLEWEKDLKEKAMPLVGIGEDMERVDFRKIHFLHGNAMTMPLPDKSVDASYTTLVLEQMPRDYPKALSEMRRVTKKYCVFIESFRESLTLADKLDLKNRDYFRFSYKTFEKYGLRPVFFSTKFLRKNKFSTGLLIAEVT
ncbi:hypothetical protein A3D66_02190 [Candidatus Kaiserbacteria bacterium RIFCSPHIGHO2_02_FULL_50_9]|uniref:Methyltransferase type 11 domain-containing protein n=1 Tax=Candidatus Kaiserbacteria bacterium RIFCSPLOWO2_01_FULL_51_21 TaxID=1798508 RepID=A0A1F6EEB0_9BACT|nr:MAG: hypothetical protein A2761_03435 [Candidatus Kaiserbacteria bacterium RIFCSPHIGHO2_01_FULL_51_33]OGG63413.1 MAG: hypothetical protein A3D66_02190 [Candidatus Kaiserbacteria bacterium RIFCSPHIGHO2_02_FULL_50_9]OGG72003.1 MAG: hypothetical protein A3A35_01265 [Candidatus Kaiserbacteria bacterium RIFCSPLOWO2_01_FULL_51_21]